MASLAMAVVRLCVIFQLMTASVSQHMSQRGFQEKRG
jgi:hypothetical protein